MKTLLSSLFSASMLLASNQASAEVIVPNDDTYGRLNNDGPHGSEDRIHVKQINGGNDAYVRKGVIQFNKVENADKVNDAKLLLDVIAFNGGSETSATFYIWGLTYQPDINEATFKYNDFEGIFAADADGINNAHPCLYDGDSVAAGKQPLGMLTIQSSDLNKTVSFSSAALTDYIRTTTGGMVTVVITRQTNSNLNTAFASKESTTLNGPRLQVTSGTEFIAPSDDTFVRGNNDGPHGSEWILVKYGSPMSDRRKGVIEFPIDANRDVREATLSIDVSQYQVSAGTTLPEQAYFNVFAIKEGASYEDINQATLKYNDLSAIMDDSPINMFGVNDNADLLGQFSVSVSDLNKTVSFTSQELIDHMNANTNGRVTFVITRSPIYSFNNSAFHTGFFSKETATHKPSLKVEYAHSPIDMMPDFEFIQKDVDGDSVRDLVLMINHPGEAGQMTADPLIIAEFVRAQGIGFGQNAEYWNRLSGTQQEFLLMATEAMNAIDSQINFTNIASDGVVDSSELDEIFLFLPSEREYGIYNCPDQACNVSVTFDGISAELTVETAYSTTTVEVNTFQSGAYFHDDGFAVGSQHTLIGVTQTYGNENGTHAGVGTGVGVGYWASASWGQNDQYGASYPVKIYGTGFQVTVYVKGSDAVSVYNQIKDAVVPFVGDTCSGNPSWSQSALVATNDMSKNMYLMSKSLNSAQLLMAGQAGAAQSLVWLEGTQADVGPEVCDAVLMTLDLGSNYANALTNWGVNSATTMTSVYDSASGWVAGSLSEVGSLEDVVTETCGCVCKLSCW